jgi:formylglycine-generating enzyme required for sulfatase activity
MARPAGLSAPRTGLADVVRLWAQALHLQPGCDAPPDGWLHALDRPGVDAPTHTLRLPPHQPEQDDEPGLVPQSPREIAVPADNLPHAQAQRLQAPVLAVVAADFEPESELSAAAQRLQTLPPLSLKDYGPLQPESAEPWQPLAPRSRWWPALRQFTPRVAAGPDLLRLVAQYARSRPPRRVPRLRQRGQFRRLLVLRDTRKCMCPYVRDFDALIAHLKAQPQAATLIEQGFHGLPPKVPPGVDAVLVLSDLGLCATDNFAATANAWAAWARTLTARGVAVQAWVPVSAQRLPTALAQDLPCVPWHESSRFRPSRGTAHTGAADACKHQAADWMARLWPRLAMAQRIEPALLRRARLLAGGQGQPEWEATLWDASDQHVAGEQVIQLWPARVHAWRQDFTGLDADKQLQVWRMFTAQHSHLSRSTLVIERLIWAAYAKPEAVAEVREALNQAEDWFRRMAEQEARNSALHWQAAQAGEDHALHAAFLHGLVARNRADAEFTRRYAEQYAPLALAVGRMEGRGVTPEAWLQAMPSAWPAEDWLPTSLQLHYRPEGAFIEKWFDAQPQAASPPAHVCRALLPQAARHSQLWQAFGQAPQRLGLSHPAGPGVLHFRDAQGRHALQLGALRRADWQHALGCDRYGVFCEVHVNGMRLRFRYLPPATTLQGSPQGIGDNDEHPQHPVTLSQGLWLAETPCTQALWGAVMGKNPSHFTQGEDAPRRPVETVSWDDVQTFLKALQPLLPPGCEAVLPTESQWEYACRAGTQTAYWWGDEPDESKANVDMTGQRSWEDKDGTTPVDRYPPNPSGLHDMHGNVWEWCADGQRDYADSPERDPEGPGDGDSRVVRGGSWFDRPGGARAAYRGWGLRGNAILRDGGFRFALRSPSGPEARPGGPGASRRGGAAGGRTVGADAPAAEPPRRDADDGRAPE